MAGRQVAPPAPILFVHNGSNWITGSERCLLDLIDGLDRSRFAPVLLCNADALASAARALDVPVHRSAGWRTNASGLLPARTAILEAREIVRLHGIRLIHANDEEPIKALVPVARAARIPLVAHLHIMSNAEERQWSWLHQVSMAVGVSQAAIRGLLDDGFPAERTRVIYNAVDPQRLGRGNARALRGALGIGTHSVVIAMIGSLIPRKGGDVVLDAFAALRARRPDCHLLLLGDGSARESLERQATSLGVGAWVHFLGRRDDVGAVLRDATDIVVSAAQQEAFPLSLLEAAYFALPVVASDIEPHRESLQAGETGLLVPVDDAAAFAEALDTLVGDEILRRRMGRAAAQRARASFLVGRYVREFEELYGTLLTQPRRRFGWVGGLVWPRAYNAWARSAAGRRLQPFRR